MKHKYLLFIIFSIFTWQQVVADNLLKIGSYQVAANTEFTVSIEADNTDPFVAFQADVPIPQGFKYIENSALLNPDRSSGHALSANIINGNTLRLIAYSASNTPFKANSGVIASFKLKSGTVPNTYPLQLQEAMMGNPQSANILARVINGQVTLQAPQLTLSTTSLDFGRVPLNSSEERGFQISNTGNIPLTVSELSFDEPQFSTSNTAPIQIAPNSQSYISVKFSPTSKGIYSKALKIKSNDAQNALLSVNLNATGYAVNEIHTGNLTGASSTSGILELSINNMEEFTDFQFDLNLPEPMSYSEGTAKLYRNQDHVVAVNPINASTLRVVAYSPSNKSFTRNSGKIIDLGFLLNGTAGYYGIGISNVVLSNATGDNILSDSFGGQLIITSADIDAPYQLDFGDVSVLSEKTKNLRISNYGQETLIVSKLLFSNEYFKNNTPLPINIAPGEYMDLPIVFSKHEEGVETGMLKILSNDPDENPFTVQLSAKAFNPNYLIVNNQIFTQGESKIVGIEINNNEPFVAVQFDFHYPEKFTSDINAALLTERKQDHVLAVTALSSTSLRVIIYSPGSKPFLGNSGAIVNIPFRAESTLSPGNYNLIFSNTLISNANSQNVLYAPQNAILTVLHQTGLKDISYYNINVYSSQQKIIIENAVGWNIQVIDDVGRVIYTDKIKSDREETSTLLSGMYIIHLSRDKNIGLRKIMVK